MWSFTLEALPYAQQSFIFIIIVQCHITSLHLLHKISAGIFVGFSFSATSSVSDYLHLLQHYNACSGSGAVTFSHATLQHLLHNLCSDWQASINLPRLCSIIISPAIQLDSTQQGSWHCEASQRKFPLSWQGGSLLLQ